MTKDFYWVRQCIIGCNTMWQLQGCRNLISLFSEKYLDEPGMKADYKSLLEILESKEIMIACEGVEM